MTQPVRIQLRRTARWRLQDVSRALNGLPAISVARPGPYGNPWTVQAYKDAGWPGDRIEAAEHCVAAHAAWLEGRKHWAHGSQFRPLPNLTPLRGHNLACWCAPGTPCHADTLLRLANA